jgi:hypothetical protein
MKDRPTPANMLAMNRSAANPSDITPRRFMVLPEELADGAPHGWMGHT